MAATKLKLLIKTNVHDILELDASSNDTVKLLKKKIAKAKEFDKSQKFYLNFHGKKLENENALITDLKIKNNSIVDLNLKHITGGLVFIKRQDNLQIFSVDYERDDSIRHLKEKISVLFDLPIQAQYLSAFLLNLKKNEISLKLLPDNFNVFEACIKCRNQMFLSLDEQYTIKSKKSILFSFF